MALQNRSTVVALKVESSEGTLLAPTGATQFIPVQDDFTMEPAFDTLENAELKNSLGPAKPIQGLENPSASFSLYLKHSGVEGQAPNYAELLQAALGTETVRSTERNTVSSSTVSVVKVDSGEGAEFSRGNSLLIKDATNGYSIRPVLSVSSDDLTLGFNLSNAPASGVNLGKDVRYSPASSGHQTMSLWRYAANGGAVEAMAGGRVVSTSYSFAAGELINGSYSIEGVGYYFDPIIIASTDIKLDFTDDQGTVAATITAKAYKDPHELADAIAAAMNDVTTETHAVTYSDSTGKYTISTSTSSVLSLLWNTGGNAANTVGDKIGFSVAADDTGATTYTSDSALSFAAPYTPSYDSADPLAAKDNEVFIGDADDNVCFCASSVDVSIETPKSDILCVCEESGKSGSLIASRAVTVSITALLDQYDADKFKRFRSNQSTSFLYNFGTKSGGNWVAGKCGSIYLPTCTISSYNLGVEDDLITLELELTAYVDDSGNGEVYVSFV